MLREVPEKSQACEINALVTSGDWAGLIRLGIFTNSPYAGMKAIQLKTADLSWQWRGLRSSLKRFVENPHLPWEAPPCKFEDVSRRLTLELMAMHWRAVGYIPSGPDNQPPSRPVLADDAARASLRCRELAHQIGDDALWGYYSFHLMAQLTSRTDWQAALPYGVACVKRLKPLLEDRLSVVGPFYVMGCGNLARIAYHLHDYSLAYTASGEAFRVGQKLYQELPQDYAELMLAASISFVGACNLVSDLEQALQTSDLAVEAIQVLAAYQHGNLIGNQYGIAAGVYINRARMLSYRGRADEVLSACVPALTHAMTAAFHEQQDFTEDLALGHDICAKALIKLGRIDEAKRAAERSFLQYIGLAKRNKSMYLGHSVKEGIDLAILVGRCGEYDEAIGKLGLMVNFVQQECNNDPMGYGSHLVRARTGIGNALMAKAVQLGSGALADDDPIVQSALRAFGNAWDDLARLRKCSDSFVHAGVELSLSIGEMHNRLGEFATAANHLRSIERDLREQQSVDRSWFIGHLVIRNCLLSDAYGKIGRNADRWELLTEAAELLKDVTWSPPTAFVDLRLEVEWRMGQWHFDNFATTGSKRSLENAEVHLQNARQCGSAVLDYLRDPSVLRKVHARLAEVNQDAISVQMELYRIEGSDERLAEAIEIAEFERARFLRESLDDYEVRTAEGTPLPDDIKEAIRKVRVAGLALITLQQSSNECPEGLVLDRETLELRASNQLEGIMRAQRELQQAERAVDAILTSSGVELPSTVRIAERKEPILQRLRRALPSDAAAILYYHIQRDRGWCFVVRSQSTHLVELPEANAGRLRDLVDRWLTAYEPIRSGLHSRSRKVGDRVLPLVLWEASELVVQDVVAVLPARIDQLVIVPHRALHLLPLHACGLDTGGFVVDRFSVSYVPSGEMLVASTSRKRERNKHPILIKCDGVGLGDDPARGMENEMLSRRLGGGLVDVVAADGENAADILPAISRASTVHFAGHARFEPTRQFESRLELGGDDASALSLRDVYEQVQLSQCDLVVLNACETGRLTEDPLDDFVSFAAGFLHSGATRVISTHWAVDGLASLLLCQRMYSRIEEGLQVAEALRQAQRWLRGAKDDLGEGLHSWDEVRRYLHESAWFNVVDDWYKQATLQQMSRTCAGRYDEVPFAALWYWAPYYLSGGLES